MWNQEELQVALRECGIPVPGDAAYDRFLASAKKLEEERDAYVLKILAAAGEGDQTEVQDTPPLSKSWPWRPFSKAKLYAFFVLQICQCRHTA